MLRIKQTHEIWWWDGEKEKMIKGRGKYYKRKGDLEEENFKKATEFGREDVEEEML